MRLGVGRAGGRGWFVIAGVLSFVWVAIFNPRSLSGCLRSKGKWVLAGNLYAGYGENLKLLCFLLFCLP